MVSEMGSQSDARRLPERFGPFVLERRLAVGGSAEVYLARPASGTRPAAEFVIKRPLAGTDPQRDFELLSREADFHRIVRHPNVVEVFGAGMVGDRPYLAMEHVDGVDAFRLLRAVESERVRLSIPVAVHIARMTADALESVHTAVGPDGPVNLVHADVSPSNIYLSATGEVKLGDFGIARVTDREETSESVSAEIRGKWRYVAPEVLEGSLCDHRADLFSLGAVLGEFIVGESIFPGASQLAVLLSIREANIAPLRRQAADLPPGLFEVIERALARDPTRRQDSAHELSQALLPYDDRDVEGLRARLGDLVKWSRDPARMARQIEGQVRDSVARMRATRAVVSSEPEVVPLVKPIARPTASHVRRANGEELHDVSFAKLIEMVVTGELSGRDQVALMGEAYRAIDEIDELARHLLPSTTTTTGRLFGPGVPDYAAPLDTSTMLEILARLREKQETGALFVEQATTSGPSSMRKEIYLQAGRLHHVSSSAREELLGEYLVRRGKITRDALDSALSQLDAHQGRLGDTLIAMGLVDVMDVFRAIRDQGRDRVGQLCAWKQGNAAFYRGVVAGPVQFSLDLDLTSPMMSGAVFASEGRPERLLPSGSHLVVRGPRSAAAADRRERGTAPTSLQLVPSLIPARPSIDGAVGQLTAARGAGKAVGEREARAALVVAQALGWIAFETP
jgi:serine/threonine-protein kinase